MSVNPALPDEVDIAVVGAGAAGIGAARRAQEHGRSVLVIEAMDRIGGRAHTVTTDGLPLDLGCGWLHSAERNPLVAEAEAAKIAVDRTPTAWGTQFRDLGFSPADQQSAHAAYAGWVERLHADAPFSDRASDALDPNDRWTPMLEALSGFINGAALEQLSVADFLAYDDAASETNWRLPSGYGALFAMLARPLPVALSTPVRAVTETGRHLSLASDRGTIRARAVVIAVSTNVLAAGHIALPSTLADQLHAAACLPLGLADKVFLAPADPAVLPADGHLIGNPHDRATGSYYLRPFGYPVIECFFGGEGARALHSEGPGAAEAFARAELGALLGKDFARSLRLVAGSGWAAEPSIGGSYSHALPGHAGARRRLGAFPSERLAFAGEACSPTDFSTAHGAWASGIRAADHLEQGLID